MANDIFQILNPGFFGLLASQNKVTNFLLLTEVDRYFASSLTVSRDDLVEALSDYIKVMHFENVGDNVEDDEYIDDDNYGTAEDSRSKASRFIKTLENRGWLELDQDDDLNFIVSRSDGFIAIYNALINLINEDTNTKEYATPLLSLYQTVTNFDYKNATNTIEVMDSLNQELEKNLLSINSRIKRFVSKAMNNQDSTEKEILIKLTIDYPRLPSYIAFHNLMSRNNPNKYIDSIINKIDNLRLTENLTALIDNYVEIKSLNKENVESFMIAKQYITKVFDDIEFQMNTIESSLETISTRNSSYVTSSKNRIKFRLNNERDIKGEIYNLLKNIRRCEATNDDEIWSSFDLYSYGEVDEKSLFKARNIYKLAPKKLPFIIKEKDPMLKVKAMELLEKKNAYSIESINEFVTKNMVGKIKSMVSEFDINSMEDFIKLMLIPVYSQNSLSIYTVGLPSELEVVVYGYRLKNYEIRLKEGVNSNDEK